MICVAEQDINKFEASSAAPRPGLGVMQHTGWQGQNRYQPYECREDGEGAEEGVVPLTLVSLGPEGSKIKNDSYLISPTLVVKKVNQLDLEQTVKLVKKNKLKLQKTVKLVKSFHRS